MKDKTGTAAKALRDGTILYEDGVALITEDMNLIAQLRMIDELMGDIAKRGSLVFYRGEVRGRMFPLASPIGKRLMAAVGYDLEAIKKAFPQGRFSPYFEAFCEVMAGAPRLDDILDPGNFHQWDDLAQTLKRVMHTQGFIAKRRAHERNVRKNFNGLVGFLRDLMTFSSKLLVVRVDVGYKLEYTDAVTFEEFQRHKDEIIKYIKASGNGAHIATVWKLEHGASRGYHAHLLCIYNGQKAHQDVTIGLTIGQHWVREVTGGRGWTHNANANKEKYRYLGIGMISHFNEEARKSLERVAAYLTKPDYHIRLLTPAGARLFGRTGYPRSVPGRVKLALTRRRAAARRRLAAARAKRVDKSERKRLADLERFQGIGAIQRPFSKMFPPCRPVSRHAPLPSSRAPSSASEKTSGPDAQPTPTPTACLPPGFSLPLSWRHAADVRSGTVTEER